MNNYLYAVNSDGTLKWRYQTGYYVHSSPAIGSDGTVYVGSNYYYLYAVNSDGTLKWSYQTGGDVYSSPAIGSDGTVYVGSTDNYLYAVNSDGTLKWSYQTGGAVRSSPAIGSDGTVYVGSTDNYLYAIYSTDTATTSTTTTTTIPTTTTTTIPETTTTTIEPTTTTTIPETTTTTTTIPETTTTTTTTIPTTTTSTTTTTTIPASQPEITTTVSSTDFGSVPVGSSSSPITVTIGNSGTANLKVYGITLSDSTNFSLDAYGCLTTAPTISPGGSCTVSLTFTPASKGSFTCELTVASDDPDTPTASVSLTGTGTVPGISVSPSKVDFSSVKVGTQATKDVTISNTGAASLSVSSLSLTDSSTSFTLDTGTGATSCGSSSPSVASGGSCTVSVSFSPYSVDAYKPSSVDANTFSGTLTIKSDDPNTPTTSVSLTGVAVSSESIKTTISVPAATEAVGSAVNGYRMVGIPMVPASADVFTTLSPSFGGGYNAGVWRMMVCEQESSFTEVTGTGQSSIAYGQGWWLISRDAKTITIEGTPLSIDFEKTLSSGYQVVACPYYDQSVSWSDVTSDASNASLGLGENLYDWDGSGDYVASSKMEPGKAYWVWADKAGTFTIKRSYASSASTAGTQSTGSGSTQWTSSNQPPPPLGPGAYVQAYAPQGECSKGKSTWLQWYAQGITPEGHKGTVNIYCSTDGGKSFSLIAGSVDNTGYYYWEPGTRSKNSMIRITSSVYPNLSSTSESFSIE